MRAKEEDKDEDGASKKRRVRFVNDEEEVLNSEDDDDQNGTDSDEIIYDSEEEDEAEREFEERKLKREKIANAGKEMINTEGGDNAGGKSRFYDIEKEVKKVQKFRPVEGVKFKQFDALGLPVDDGFDYYRYITTDTNTLDNVIDASPAQMEAVYHPKGERFDRDKEEDEMNDEGKKLHFILMSKITLPFYPLICREGSICGA